MTAVRQRQADRDPLVAVRAATELAGRRRLAAVVAAAEAGRTQREIGDALNVSQPAVAQMLARARRWPEEWQRTPWQVALEYAAGELTREQMRKEFAGWPWTYGHFEDADQPWPEGYVRGSWDELHDAVSDRLITHDDYEYVYDKTQ